MKKYVRSFDVIIIGSGVAACATAITLKNELPKANIAVIDERSKQAIISACNFRIGETLSPHAVHTLRQMGIWEAFQAEEFKESYGTSAAWGSGKVHHNEFMYSPFGYGWHLDCSTFKGLMISEARKRGVRFYLETYLRAQSEESDGWLLMADSGTKKFELSAKFVVDASGKKAAFALKNGASRHKVDRLVGIYRYYKINSEKKQHVEGTFIESDPLGWWYSALLPNGHLVLAFMTDSDIASEHRLEKPLAFNRLLERSGFTKTRSEATKAAGQPKQVITHSQFLDRVVGNNWLTVGEAAMSYDPLATIGIYKGLSTNLYAAHAILDYMQGDPSGLGKYEKLMEQQFKDFELKRAAHYAGERRYERYSFWQRRHTNSKEGQFFSKTNNFKHEDSRIG